MILHPQMHKFQSMVYILMTTVVARGGSDRKDEPYPWMILLDMMVLCVR